MTAKPAPEPRSRYAGFENLPLRLTVRVGRTRLTMARLSELEPGTVLALDRTAGAPFDLIAGEVMLGRVEPVVSNDEVVFKLVACAEKHDDDAE